jgi:hypothetical protein
MDKKMLGSIVLILVVIGGLLAFINKKPIVPNNPVTNSDTKTYSNTDISFEYPALLSLKEDGNKVTLSHSVPYKHPDPCDFKGDAPELDKLTDFSTTFTVVAKNLKDTQADNFVWQYESVKVGSLDGYKGESGIEGCGLHTYIFPISQYKTLVVKRPYVTEFNPIIADYQKYLNLPNVILPAQADEYFSKILLSLKFVK